MAKVVPRSTRLQRIRFGPSLAFPSVTPGVSSQDRERLCTQHFCAKQSNPFSLNMVLRLDLRRGEQAVWRRFVLLPSRMRSKKFLSLWFVSPSRCDL